MTSFKLKFSHLILILAVLNSSCAHLPSSSKVYELKIHGEVGDQERSSIDLSSETFFYENKELSHKTVRVLGVKIQSEILEFDSNGNIWVRNSTTEKEGNENLHGFGFPELHEAIDMKLNPYGRVLDVKGFQKDSIFYLPPVLLPTHLVKINDSWKETFRWMGEGQPEYLKTTIECTLLDEEDWEGEMVLKIQMIATTTLDEKNVEFTFSSDSDGYFLWDPKKSVVVYAQSEAKDETKALHAKSSSVTHTKFISKQIPFF